MTGSYRYDALIAGGGPAGATLAITLAKAGRTVVVMEKSRAAQHKVCGELLSPECLPSLRRVGIDPEKLGAHAIHSVRLAARELIAETRLPHSALSLTRRTLDEALLERAKRAGAKVLRGFTLESLSRSGQADWRAQAMSATTEDDLTVEGREAFLATGKHDLHGWGRSAKGTQAGLVAMKMYFALTPEQQAELCGNVELILFPGGYGGLQPVERGHANLCVLLTRKKLRSLAGKWERVLDHMQTHSTHLALRLCGAVPVLERPLALSSIPYGYCAPVPQNLCSPWRVGDQAAVVPSFSGDGMAIAFHTAELAAELYLEGASAAAFHAEIRSRYGLRLGFATLISRLAIATPAVSQAVRMWPGVLSEIFKTTRVPGSAVFARDLPPV